MDVVMIIGADWSSEIPYYSESKSICVPDWKMDELKADPQKFIHKLNTPDIKHILLVFDHKNDMSELYCQRLGPILGLNRILIDERTKSVLFSLKTP